MFYVRYFFYVRYEIIYYWSACLKLKPTIIGAYIIVKTMKTDKMCTVNEHVTKNVYKTIKHGIILESILLLRVESQ